MKTRSLLASCLGLALLGTSCATGTTLTMKPPGVSAGEYQHQGRKHVLAVVTDHGLFILQPSTPSSMKLARESA